MPYTPPGQAHFDLSAGKAYTPPLPAFFEVTDGLIQPSHIPALTRVTSGAWSRPSKRSAITAISNTEATALRYAASFQYGFPEKRNADQILAWDALRIMEVRRSSEWGTPHITDARIQPAYDSTDAIDLAASGSWGRAGTRNGEAIDSSYRDTDKKDMTLSSDFGRVNLSIPKTPLDAPVRRYMSPDPLEADFDLSTARAYLIPEPAAFVMEFEPPHLRIRPTFSHRTSSYGAANSEAIKKALPWGRGQYYRREREWGIDYPTYDGPVGKEDPDLPEIKLSYIIMNVVNVVKLPDETPVWIRDISIDLDIDSWSWRMSGTVKGQASLDQIKPTASGPVDIRVTINGHAWVFMVERYTGDRRVGEGVFQIQAVSRTQYLARPYAPRRSKINGADINAQQAMNEELQNTGFTLDWVTFGDEATPDWTIPAGALAYVDKTPMEVIKMIADAAGAIVVPAPGSDTLTIKPRFPTPPWGLGAATMDRVVHHSMIRSISEEWRPSALYNAAYVSGISYGRGTMVTRQGTAGDKPAPDTVNELQVAVECNRHRGEMLIADSGNRSIYTMDLHIPESATAPGLILPGHEIEFQGQSDTWRGYVLATTITANGPGAAPVWQQITINRPREH